MNPLGINSQKNSLPNMKIHVLEWKDGLEKDSTETLRSKLQNLYSSMEVQILPMLTKMRSKNSDCVILSMQDLLENSSSLESVLLSLARVSNPVILASLKINLEKRLIYFELVDSTTLSTRMELILSDCPVELDIIGQVQIFKIKTPE